jgi:hypothetical protein
MYLKKPKMSISIGAAPFFMPDADRFQRMPSVEEKRLAILVYLH